MKKILLLFLLLSPIIDASAPTDEQHIEKVKKDPYLLLELFGNAFKSTRNEYVDNVDDKKLIEAAINGMLSSLDPHSNYLTERDFDDIDSQTKGEFGGLGMEVSGENGFVRIIAPMDDTPADRAGLKAGDIITHVDDEILIGISLSEAINRMRGPAGTKVKLKIAREGKEPFDKVLTREMIQIESIRWDIVEDIGILRVSTFSTTTTPSAQKAIQDMLEHHIKGIVLDLRNNPGGLLEEAVGISDLFLSQGEIVSTRSRRPEETIILSATTPDMTQNLPLVVLINEGSASASEIVAGAIQDHKRGVIVGTPSFGKGSVQTLKPIPGYGAIKMTTARYYTPSGNSIQGRGITPDVLIPRATITEEPIIQGFKEENLKGALGEAPGQKLKKNKKKKETTQKKIEHQKDYQLSRAIDILKGIIALNLK